MKATGGGGRRSPPKLRGGGGGGSSLAEGQISRLAGGISLDCKGSVDLNGSMLNDGGGEVSRMEEENTLQGSIHVEDGSLGGESGSPHHSVGRMVWDNAINGSSAHMEGHGQGSGRIFETKEYMCMDSNVSSGGGLHVPCQEAGRMKFNATASGNVQCTQGVRQFVFTANSAQEAQGKHGASMYAPRSLGESSKNAWFRPKVVSLPSKAELGDFSWVGNCVQLDEDEVRSTMGKFDMALVGRLFGRRLPFNFLNEELQCRWGQFGSFRLLTISSDYFICFFNSVESRNSVLMGGPWIIAGQVLGLDLWSPSFTPASSAGFVTPVWVRLPGLPLYCWGAKNIARIASPFGEPLWMDAATERMERGLFAVSVFVWIYLSLWLRAFVSKDYMGASIKRRSMKDYRPSAFAAVVLDIKNMGA